MQYKKDYRINAIIANTVIAAIAFPVSIIQSLPVSSPENIRRIDRMEAVMIAVGIGG